MADPRRRPEVFSNPFFVLLMASSLAFVLTIMGYLISPYILAPDPARPRPGPNSIAAGGLVRSERSARPGDRVRDHAGLRGPGDADRPLVLAEIEIPDGRRPGLIPTPG